MSETDASEIVVEVSYISKPVTIQCLIRCYCFTSHRVHVCRANARVLRPLTTPTEVTHGCNFMTAS